MSHAAATSTSSTHGPLRVIAPLLVCLLAMWLGHQGSIVPSAPQLFILPLLAIAGATPVLIAIALGACGWGYVARRALLVNEQRLGPVQMALGLAVMWLAVWLLAWAGLLNGITAWGLCGIGVLLNVWQLAQPEQQQIWRNFRWPAVPWTVTLAALPAGLLLVAATCPPGSIWPTEAFGYDVMSYHLQLPAEWLAQGRMTGLHHNAYSYLPNLVEVGYMQVAAMKGSLYSAIITTQLLHACTAMLAAWIVGHWLTQRLGGAAGGMAVAAMLALPWVLITGSLAYDEMAMLALAAAAAAVTFSPAGTTLRGAAVVGLLCGAATLAKLPAGPGIALPLGLALLLRWHAADDTRPTMRQGVALAAVAGAVGLLVLLPWLIRNGVATGNPVFPNAAASFGTGHWTDAEAARWAAGHGPHGSAQFRAGQLIERWLLNPGFGGWPIGGGEIQGNDIARFSATYSLPLFHLVALAGLILGVVSKKHRRLALAMLLMLAAQVAFWLLATHMQSRFMLAALLPTAVGVALAWHHLVGQTQGETHQTRQRITHAAGAILVLAIFAMSMRTLDEGVRGGIPLSAAAGTLPDESDRAFFDADTGAWGNHPLNHLPSGSKVLLVGDANQLIYITTPMIYNTAFDRSLLAEAIAAHPDDPAAVTQVLRERGVTHVWINHAELARLAGSYGLADELHPDSLSHVTAKWRPIYSIPGPGRGNAVTLLAIPDGQ